jgi:hypothetical protein
MPNSDDSNLIFAVGHEEANNNAPHHSVVNPALSAPFPPSLNVGNIFNVPIELIDVYLVFNVSTSHLKLFYILQSDIIYFLSNKVAI